MFRIVEPRLVINHVQQSQMQQASQGQVDLVHADVQDTSDPAAVGAKALQSNQFQDCEVVPLGDDFHGFVLQLPHVPVPGIVSVELFFPRDERFDIGGGNIQFACQRSDGLACQPTFGAQDLRQRRMINPQRASKRAQRVLRIISTPPRQFLLQELAKQTTRMITNRRRFHVGDRKRPAPDQQRRDPELWGDPVPHSQKLTAGSARRDRPTGYPLHHRLWSITLCQSVLGLCWIGDLTAGMESQNRIGGTAIGNIVLTVPAL